MKVKKIKIKKFREDVSYTTVCPDCCSILKIGYAYFYPGCRIVCDECKRTFELED